MSVLERVLAGIGKEIGKKSSEPTRAKLMKRSPLPSCFTRGAWPDSLAPQGASSQILQVATVPLSLQLSEYRDALSDSNPQGDIIAAMKFQQLVDPVPVLTHEYVSSPSSIEAVYGAILRGATASGENTFVMSLLANARRKFETDAQAEFVSHGKWRIVEANPHDWYAGDPAKYATIRIPLDSPDDDDPDELAFLGRSAPLRLTLGDQQRPLSEKTRLTQCRIEYMLVQFHRPWMDFILFKTAGWWLAGQSEGYCSSGRRDKNNGILPLVTTGMILARSASFEGEWDPVDEAAISEALEAGKDVYLGPYKLRKEAAPVSTVNVVAWISALVPNSPKASGSVSGRVQVRNKLSVDIRCVVSWDQNGEKEKTKCKLDGGNSNTIDIPRDADNVGVRILVQREDGWDVVFRKNYSTVPTRRFVVRGSPDNVVVKEKQTGQATES